MHESGEFSKKAEKSERDGVPTKEGELRRAILGAILPKDEDAA